MRYLLILLLSLCSGLAVAQEVIPGPYTPPPVETSNTVYSTVNPPPEGAQFQWSGFMPTQSNGGGLSGGNIPGYNTATGTFLFGYTQGVVNYSTAVNYALRNAGLGIQVTGFRYSWEYFNQDFSRGSLSANVSLTSKNNTLLESYNYNLPKTTSGWTNFSGGEVFSNPYVPQELGNLQLTLRGKDDRFWAGYYGPQIRAIDLKLVYEPIPAAAPEYLRWVKMADEWGTFTVTEPTTVRYGGEGKYLYAEFQPGTYACNNFEWGKDPIGGVYKTCSYGTNTPLPPPPTTTTTTVTATTSTVNEITTAAAQPVTDTVVKATAPTNTITEPTTTITMTSTGITSNTTTSASAGTSPTGAITVIKDETQVTKEATTEKSSSGPSLSSVLANIRANQDKQNTIAMSAVAASIEVANNVTQKAEQIAIEAAQTSAQQALQTALNSSISTGGNRTANNGMNVMENNRQTVTMNNTQTNMLQGSNNNNVTFDMSTRQESKSTATSSVLDLFTRPESKNLTPSTVVTIDYSLRPQTTIATSQYVAPSLSLIRPESRPTETIVDNQFVVSEVRPILRQPSIEIFTNNNISASNNIAFGKKGDPIQDYIESNNALFNEMKAESRPTTVRSNVQDNDIAGGVKIERMAVVPNGFSAYSMFILTNIAFYEPKEIYKNNVPKDNVRSMYFLEKGNTDTYNKMIEGQYK